MKQSKLIPLFLLAFAMFLVACGGAAEIECDDPIGCVTIEEGEPIKLASALVISGANEQLGLDSQYGVEIAIAQRGEVLGHEVTLQTEDDGCNSEGGQAAGQKIVSDDQIVGVVGTSCSGAAIAMAPIVCDAGIVMISPSNTGAVLTDAAERSSCYFRTAHNDNIQGKAMAEYVYNDLGVRNAAAIHDGDTYTEGLASVFRDEFEALGGTIVAFEQESPDATNVEPLLTTVAAANPELVYFPVFTNLGALIAKTSQDIDGMDGVILASADGVQSPDFLEAAGAAAEGMYVSGPNLSFGNSLYDTFLTDYQDAYGTEPLSVFHAHAYDATNLILDAIEEVAVESGGTISIGRQALIDAVDAVDSMDGITGNVSCAGNNGDCADANISVSEVSGGEFNAIWP